MLRHVTERCRDPVGCRHVDNQRSISDHVQVAKTSYWTPCPTAWMPVDGARRSSQVASPQNIILAFCAPWRPFGQPAVDIRLFSVDGMLCDRQIRWERDQRWRGVRGANRSAVCARFPFKIHVVSQGLVRVSEMLHVERSVKPQPQWLWYKNHFINLLECSCHW